MSVSQGSTCPKCGFHTEQILITCPRCRNQMLHDQCRNCGRCAGGRTKDIKK